MTTEKMPTVTLDREEVENLIGKKLSLEELKDNSGFLPYNDKSNPEDIKDALEMSKKSFKKAIGTLYKQKLILIKEDGIYLNQH